MRWNTGAAALIFLMCTGMTDCCGVGGPELMAYSPDSECSLYDCGVIVGGELETELFTGGQWVEDITLDPPEVADLAIDGARITIKPRLAGSATMRVTFADSEYPFEVGIMGVALATTEVIPDRSITGFQRVYPPGPKQMFTGSTLRVIAAHRSASGQRLLGHGFEDWTVTGGTVVATDPDQGAYTTLVRDVIAGTDPQISISARPGSTPLELDVLPAGSTRILELATKTGGLRFGELVFRAGQYLSIPVSAFSADGRFIHGHPPGVGLGATLADETLASITVNDAERSLRIMALCPGRTDLDVTFDGVTTRFTLVIH